MFDQLPVNVQLSAYLDEELPEPLARRLSLRLQKEPALQCALDSLRSGSALGNLLFAALLKEPVPLTFARAIRRGQGIAAKLTQDV
ncbi:hypothetical protein [Rhizobium sp. L1K21]|uniref:hypothetical protein n=1 Tax=Rhizobium sp. L1K21 TaxID=2954933 RepID=UPI0020932342|nr:hypothetical protein [Rhizobium sp. L1K21]MCO6185409.1 hypothetical protein [Rhizobium sp. L1K21]